jgi:hypothetical protein
MTTKHDARTAQLRSLLVATALISAPAKKRPWRVISLLAAVALVSGATGAVSAAAIVKSTPYTDDVIAALALSVARPNSTALGQPHYVSSTGTTTIDLGDKPATATGIAIRTACTALGSFKVELDGALESGVTCTEVSTFGGGGGVTDVSTSGAHTVTVTSADGAGFTVWMVWVQEPPLPESSSQQTAELADGVVTRAEYLAAFDRYVGCMSAAGFEVDAPNRDSTVIRYTITGSAVDSGADELCYVSEFQEVDSDWQVQNQDTSETARLFNSCLEANGLAPAKTVTGAYRALTEAGVDIGGCLMP